MPQLDIRAFINDVKDVLQRRLSTRINNLFGDFNARIGTNSKTWKDVIDRHGDQHLMTGIYCSFVVARVAKNRL